MWLSTGGKWWESSSSDFLLITVFIIHHSESFIMISCFQISIFCLRFTVLILCCVDDWRMVLPFPSKAWWTLPWSLGCQLQAGANVGGVSWFMIHLIWIQRFCSFLRIRTAVVGYVVRCAVCILWVWWWPDSLIKKMLCNHCYLLVSCVHPDVGTQMRKRPINVLLPSWHIFRVWKCLGGPVVRWLLAG